ADTDVIRIQIARGRQDNIVTFDGQESVRLMPGDEVIVKKSESAAKIVKFEDKDYYQILRRKLWKNLD
ncbi:MAG: NAD(+)/NADH kinase, partial [Selenomonadaceae bacterium]|nr:NAD(+)/NADH kinase [Selenomonadaceae bacterium]